MEIDTYLMENGDVFFGNISREILKNFSDYEFEMTTSALAYLLSTPIIIVAGIIGNILSFLVFTMTHQHRKSSSIYLSALSLVDTGFLLAMLLLWFGLLKPSFFFINKSALLCKLMVYLFDSLSFISFWLVVVCTIERYMIIKNSISNRNWCTTRRAKIIMLITISMGLMIFAWHFWTTGLVELFDNQSSCMTLTKYYKIHLYLTIFVTIITLVIPTICVVTLNSIIFSALYKVQERNANSTQSENQLSSSRHGHFRHTAMHSSSGINRIVRIRFSDMENFNLNSQLNDETFNRNNERNFLPLKRRAIRSARMMLILSTVSVFLSFPSFFLRIRALVLTQSVAWAQIFQLFYHLNFAINFFVYSASDRPFRIGLKRLAKRFQNRIISIWNT